MTAKKKTSSAKTSAPRLKKLKRKRVLLALGWYARGLHRGVAAYAKEARWVLNIEMERNFFIPKEWNNDGVICMLGMHGGLDEAVTSWGIPAVSIGPISFRGIPSVLPDNDEIGRMAAEHFLMRGFKNFAFYKRSGGLGEKLRQDGFRIRVAKEGLPLHIIDWAAVKGNTYAPPDQVKPQWLEKQLSALPKPLAIFSEYDDRALEILQACENAEISVPEEIAVLGVDNDELRCTFALTPLSSIEDDQKKQGYEAARLLDRMMRGEEIDLRPVLVQPLGVVSRKSSDILAIDHPNVAKALRIIWEHYTENLTTEMVASEVPMSSRRLHDAFVRHVGRTMADEIARRRIEHAKRLLEDPEWRKMEEVAESAGFTSADHMSKLFGRKVGKSPSAYRKEQLLS